MKKINASEGVLSKQIFVYTIPLILSIILQNLFSIADKAVLGNMAGTVAVASVAATGTVSSLIISGAVGLSSGVAIVLARFIGQKDKEKIRATIDTALIASVALGVLVAIAGILLAPVFLTMTNCPEECYEGALIYMRIILAAAPATLLYNYASSILRTLGDTQRPLTYVAISGVVNLSLNILLCFILSQKVIAVAVATVTSTFISTVLVMRRLCRIDDSGRVDIRRMRFHFSAFVRIFRFGIPSSISSLVLPLGNLQITTAINSFGASAIAGHSASVSVESITFAVTSGFGSASMVFMGQNIGAKNRERVRKSFWLCLAYSVAIAGTLGVFSYFTGRLWIGCITGMDATAAIDFGMIRMFYVSLFMFINAASNILTGALRAFGYPFLTSATNIAFNLGFRVLWMQFIYPLNEAFSTIMLCYTVSWILNFLFYAVFVFFVYRKYVKTGICKKI